MSTEKGNGLTGKVRLTRPRRWVGQEWAEVRRSVRSALIEAGPERDTLVQSLKAAGAAIAAWAVSGWWFQAPMALLAPWTAIAMVGSTVYQSVRTGIQQFAIIALGTVWASAAMAFTRDQTMAAMLFTLPFMMLLGNYRRFGSQGIYGATTALFVITGGVSSTSTVGHRLLETLIGAVIGLLVNAFVLPPVHLRSVRDRLVRLARETADVLGAMAEGLREENGLEKSESWHHSAGGLTVSLQNVSEARRWAMEGSRWNPGGRLRRTGPKPPPFSEDMRWGRVCTRVLAITRTLEVINDDNELAPPSTDFFRLLSDVLGLASSICVVEAELLVGSGNEATQHEHRDAAVREAWSALSSLTDTFHRQEPWAAAVGGELLLEARQLLMELVPSA
ncbi:aromatic acid exporter family protein [Streptomyces microflavus]|uniref:aromatic acid exporter family protein n=1 Tax=Streptomyces microflavus TaxID=1919 RepID=UPI0037D670C0